MRAERQAAEAEARSVTSKSRRELEEAVAAALQEAESEAQKTVSMLEEQFAAKDFELQVSFSPTHFCHSLSKA